MADVSKLPKDESKSKPKFKTTTVQQIKEPKSSMKEINESVLKYYDTNTVSKGEKVPYIVYLEEKKVESAKKKETTQFVKSSAGLVFKVVIAIAILALIIFILSKLNFSFY
jgi:hypothetical protein